MDRTDLLFVCVSSLVDHNSQLWKILPWLSLRWCKLNFCPHRYILTGLVCTLMNENTMNLQPSYTFQRVVHPHKQKQWISLLENYPQNFKGNTIKLKLRSHTNKGIHPATVTEKFQTDEIRVVVSELVWSSSWANRWESLLLDGFHWYQMGFGIFFVVIFGLSDIISVWTLTCFEFLDSLFKFKGEGRWGGCLGGDRRETRGNRGKRG